MKQFSLAEIKQELQNLTAKELTELCLRLARYKKENKEFAAYLLFDANDADAYVENIKEYMNELFADVNTTNIYFAKKTLRKIIRYANRYIKFMAQKQAEATIRIHFCNKLKAFDIFNQKNKTLYNMYLQQIKKIETALAGLHEDVQYDFAKQLATLKL